MLHTELADSTIKKRCAEAGIDDDKDEYLFKLFDGCAGMYGFITLRDMWKVHLARPDHEDHDIRRSQFIAYSTFSHREYLATYDIFDPDELRNPYIYDNGSEKPPTTEMDRIVINRNILSSGKYKFDHFYYMQMRREGVPIKIDTDYLEQVVDLTMTEQEAALYDALCELTSTAKKVAGEFGDLVRNTNKGKSLKDIRFTSYYDTVHKRNFKYIDEAMKIMSIFLDRENQALTYDSNLDYIFTE